MGFGIIELGEDMVKAPMVHSECGNHPRIFHEILSFPHNTIMDLNNVMIIVTNVCLSISPTRFRLCQ